MDGDTALAQPVQSRDERGGQSKRHNQKKKKKAPNYMRGREGKRMAAQERAEQERAKAAQEIRQKRERVVVTPRLTPVQAFEAKQREQAMKRIVSAPKPIVDTAPPQAYYHMQKNKAVPRILSWAEEEKRMEVERRNLLIAKRLHSIETLPSPLHVDKIASPRKATLLRKEDGEEDEEDEDEEEEEEEDEEEEASEAGGEKQNGITDEEKEKKKKKKQQQRNQKRRERRKNNRKKKKERQHTRPLDGDLTLNHFSRKREQERIQRENEQIAKHLMEQVRRPGQYSAERLGKEAREVNKRVARLSKFVVKRPPPVTSSPEPTHLPDLPPAQTHREKEREKKEREEREEREREMEQEKKKPKRPKSKTKRPMSSARRRATHRTTKYDNVQPTIKVFRRGGGSGKHNDDDDSGVESDGVFGKESDHIRFMHQIQETPAPHIQPHWNAGKLRIKTLGSRKWKLRYFKVDADCSVHYSKEPWLNPQTGKFSFPAGGFQTSIVTRLDLLDINGKANGFIMHTGDGEESIPCRGLNPTAKLKWCLYIGALLKYVRPVSPIRAVVRARTSMNTWRRRTAEHANANRLSLRVQGAEEGEEEGEHGERGSQSAPVTRGHTRYASSPTNSNHNSNNAQSPPKGYFLTPVRQQPSTDSLREETEDELDDELEPRTLNGTGLSPRVHNTGISRRRQSAIEVEAQHAEQTPVIAGLSRRRQSFLQVGNEASSTANVDSAAATATSRQLASPRAMLEREIKREHERLASIDLETAKFSYPPETAEFSIGERVVIRTDSVQNVTAFSLSMSAPDWLQLDKESGELRGVATTAGTFSIHVAGYSASATVPHEEVVVIRVLSEAPPDVEYFSALTAICDEPLASPVVPIVHAGTVPGSFSAPHGLPAGLEIDAKTGAITGTPTKPFPSQEVSIEVTSASGFSTLRTVILVHIKQELQPTFAYPSAPVVCFVGQSFEAKPTNVQHVEAFSSPLDTRPHWAFLDPVTGEWSGNARDCGEFRFRVRGTTRASRRTAEADFLLTVQPEVPPFSAVHYGVNNSLSWREHTLIEPLAPTIEGQVGEIGSFVALRGVPEGLSVDWHTGVISGTPVRRQAAKELVIQVKSESGYTSRDVVLHVTITRHESSEEEGEIEKKHTHKHTHHHHHRHRTDSGTSVASFSEDVSEAEVEDERRTSPCPPSAPKPASTSSSTHRKISVVIGTIDKTDEEEKKEEKEEKEEEGK